MVDHNSAVFDSHLLLDPAIRNWVVLPMLLLLLLVGIGRHYVQVLIKTETKVSASDFEKEFRYKQTAARAGRLRMFGSYINDNVCNRIKHGTIYLFRKCNLNAL